MYVFGQDPVGIVNVGKMNEPSLLHNRVDLLEQKRNLQHGCLLAGDGKVITPGLNLDLFQFFEEP